ncbi:hypothetical protein [Microbacterium sp. LWH13-1.2]|uniref:hypothetical protein n=1 Tax=Microbacterium sp. LWH13-1.2 TaxID=3135260 RepID=UPI0031388530
MAPLRLRSTTALLAAATMMLALAGCAPGASTGLTVTYEVDGAERTVTLDPDQITCDDGSVHGLAISNDPQGRFSIGLDGPRRGSVGVGSDDGLVLFEATGLDLSASGAELTVGASEGEVSLVEGWAPGDDVNASGDDAEQYSAVLSGSISCDDPVTVPTPEPESSGSAPPVGVSVRFTAGDTVHLAAFVPGDVSCGARVSATGVDPNPGTISFDSSGRVQMTVTDEAGTTEFRADGVDVAAESDGSYWLRDIEGDVKFWEGQTGGTLSQDDAESGTGTLSALIVCP